MAKKNGTKMTIVTFWAQDGPGETSGKVDGIGLRGGSKGGGKCPPTNTFLKNKKPTRCHLLYFI